MKIVALSGGVGAAKLLEGFYRVVNSAKLTVIVNTGDDLELYGLHISPDLDIVTYTLAGIVNKKQGWGIENDTFNALNALARYSLETWFKLGDKDLATHIYRTYLLKQGYTLLQATDIIRRRLGVKVKILPMTNERVATKLLTNTGLLSLQEYLVKYGARNRVFKVIYDGIEKAKAPPEVVAAIKNSNGVIICPSNPFLSIGPILAIKEIREALKYTRRIVAVSPIVGGKALKGPADKIMRELGIENSAYGIAEIYKGIIDTLVIDKVDVAEKERIENEFGIEVYVTNTVMKTLRDKVLLATFVLNIL